MSELGGKINFGKVERMEVELPLNEKYKDEATRSERVYDKKDEEYILLYFQLKTLNIQSFNIERFSNINYINNMNSIVNYIKATVSDEVHGIKFKSGGHDFAVTYLHAQSKHQAKQIGEGGFGEVFMTDEIASLDGKIRKYFAIKKISNPTCTTSAIKEIAYNEFKHRL